jgi:glycosyltransferase involved in cell wall biosynthesis
MNLSQKKITGYDVVISYLHNSKNTSFYGGCNDFVLNCVDAPRKVTFLHCDYVKCGAHTAENAKQYARFDVIAACSNGCREVFVNALPELEYKTITVRNCHDFDAIRMLANQSPVDMDSQYVNIVTVARLSKEKGVLRAIEAIASLGDMKEKIRYFIVGAGSQQLEIEKRIEELNLSHIVTVCGALANPYGYMKSADLLLIPSYEEAAPMVIDESASLGTPILSTFTSSAEDMITKREFGWVCENSLEGIVKDLKMLVGCSNVLSEKKQDLKTKILNNDEALLQFDNMIG